MTLSTQTVSLSVSVMDATLPDLSVCHLHVKSDVTSGLFFTKLGTDLGHASTACEFEGDWVMNFEPTHVETDYEFVHHIEGFVELGPADYPNWIKSWGKGITYGIMTKQILDLDCKYVSLRNIT